MNDLTATLRKAIDELPCDPPEPGLREPAHSEAWKDGWVQGHIAATNAASELALSVLRAPEADAAHALLLEVLNTPATAFAMLGRIAKLLTEHGVIAPTPATPQEAADALRGEDEFFSISAELLSSPQAEAPFAPDLGEGEYADPQRAQAANRLFAFGSM